MGDEAPEAEEAPVEEEADGPEELSTGLKLPFSEQVVEEIWALHHDHEAQSEALMKKLDEFGCLEPDPYPDGFRNDLICDFHLHNMIHCKSICLTARKTAVFFAVMHHVLDAVKRKSSADASPAENFTAVEAFGEFQRLLLDHAVNRPPEQIEVFLGSEARELTDYTTLTFFKHYLLYQYSLMNLREIETIRVQNMIEAPPMVMPSLLNARLLKTGPLPNQEGSSPEPEKDGDASAADAEPGEETAGAEELGDPSVAADGDGMPPDAMASDAAKATEDTGVSPEVERLIDERVAEAERTLTEKLAQREEHFMKQLQARKG